MLSTLASATIRVAHTRIADHVWLHPGTDRPSEISDGGEAYTEAARVPVLERRLLTADEIGAITATWHWPPPTCVAGFPIDPVTIREIQQPDALGPQNPRSDTFKAVGERLWKSLCDMNPVFSLGPVQWLGVSTRPSGLRTSTFDISIGRRIGMHLDSWDKTPLDRRHTARTRLCINLGLRTRSLLFLPHDIRAVVSALEGDSSVHSANLGERFCARFGETPVLRLDVPPGWAYLAPTENLIHDGCSDSSSSPDVTAAWLGRIGCSSAF